MPNKISIWMSNDKFTLLFLKVLFRSVSEYSIRMKIIFSKILFYHASFWIKNTTAWIHNLIFLTWLNSLSCYLNCFLNFVTVSIFRFCSSILRFISIFSFSIFWIRIDFLLCVDWIFFLLSYERFCIFVYFMHNWVNLILLYLPHNLLLIYIELSYDFRIFTLRFCRMCYFGWLNGLLQT